MLIRLTSTVLISLNFYTIINAFTCLAVLVSISMVIICKGCIDEPRTSTCQERVAPSWNTHVPWLYHILHWPQVHVPAKGGSISPEQCHLPICFFFCFDTIHNLLSEVHSTITCSTWPVIPILTEWLRIIHFHNYLWHTCLTNPVSVFFNCLHNLSDWHAVQLLRQFSRGRAILVSILSLCTFAQFYIGKWIRNLSRNVDIYAYCSCASPGLIVLHVHMTLLTCSYKIVIFEKDLQL